MAYRSDQHDKFLTPTHHDHDIRDDDPTSSLHRFEEESATSGRRIAIYGVAVVALIGALIYGMSSATNTDTASQHPPSVTAQRMAPPAAPIRDVTPRNNMQPGTTTGAAPSQPAPTTSAPNAN